MAAGGRREGAGRPKGTRDKPIYDPGGEQGKLMPLGYMLELLRDEDAPKQARMQAAKDAAPYCHARLQATQLDIEGDVHIELISYLDADD